MADPGFSRWVGVGGTNPKGGVSNLFLENFLPKKLHENERNSTGGGVEGVPPVGVSSYHDLINMHEHP